MKNIIKITAAVAMITAVLTGCAGQKIPDNWYNKTLDYYSEGLSNNWANERDDLDVSEEMKDSSNKFGYYLKDLDGDGTDELLIGIIDDLDETRFIDLYIWHSDIGSFRILHAGDDYYIYLCENNIIRMDSWHGSTPEIRYFKYDSGNNSFHVLDTESKTLKVELTPF